MSEELAEGVFAAWGVRVEANHMAPGRAVSDLHAPIIATSCRFECPRNSLRNSTTEGTGEGFEAYLFVYADGHGGAAIMTNGQNGGRLAQETCASLASAYGWNHGAPEQRKAMALTPERASEFVGDYVAPGPPGQPSVTVTITAEGDKLWVEAPPVIPRQRFYVASDAQAFTLESPILALKLDEQARPVGFEVGRGVFAERKK